MLFSSAPSIYVLWLKLNRTAITYWVYCYKSAAPFVFFHSLSIHINVKPEFSYMYVYMCLVPQRSRRILRIERRRRRRKTTAAFFAKQLNKLGMNEEFLFLKIIHKTDTRTKWTGSYENKLAKHVTWAATENEKERRRKNRQ